MSEIVDAAALAACATAVVPTALRWGRVAQREHYLAGAATRFARRWWTCAPGEMVAAAVAVAAVGASVVVPGVALVAAAVTAFGPRRLGVRGRTSKLVWTRRLRSVLGALLVLIGAIVAAGAVAAGLRGAVVASAAAVVLLPGLLDVALAALAPLEDRVARRFVEQAADKVRRVAPAVVGITGSYGKTTTKGYVAQLVAGRYAVLSSPRSFNNRAGLARTVNELLVPGTDVLVAEMGAYGRGEIAALCSWLPPRVAVITAIGPVHLERFKSLDNTLAAKSEICEGAEYSVLNVDDHRLAGLAERLEAAGRKVVRCSGVDRGADVAVTATRDGGLELYRAGELVGAAGVSVAAQVVATSNVACAVAVAVVLGCTDREVLERLGSLPVAEHRLEERTAPSGAIVLDDTFNSNPAGTALALATLDAHGSAGRKVVVTPGMVELGPLQHEANAAFAEAAAAVATDVVVVGRTNRRALVAGASRAGASSAGGADLHVVADRAEAVELVRAWLGAGDVVLYENDLPDHFP